MSGKDSTQYGTERRIGFGL